MIIGIDPGLTGALAYITDKDYYYDVIDLKTVGTAERKHIDPIWAKKLFSTLNLKEKIECVFLEKPPKFMNKSRQWTYFCMGRTQGILESACENLEIKLKLIDSKEWKKHFDLFGKSKKGSLELAREFFPNVSSKLKRNKDHNRAEALLISKYSKQNNGDKTK